MEQPLEEGPPDGPYAGAKWKRALCFRGHTCEERVNMSTTLQPIRPGGRGTNFMWKVQQRLQPRIWYVAISNCDGERISLNFEWSFVGGGPWWSRQFRCAG